MKRGVRRERRQRLRLVEISGVLIPNFSHSVSLETRSKCFKFCIQLIK